MTRQESDDGSIILYTYDRNGNLIQEEATRRETQEESLALFSYGESEAITGSAISTEVPGFFPGVQETVTGSTIQPETTALFPEDLGTVMGERLVKLCPVLQFVITLTIALTV